MEFFKMQGAGNDFILLNNMELEIPIEKLNNLAKTICARRTSLGGDGLILVDKASGHGDFKMRFYNQDGSLGEMCGNGARCIARYAYLNNIAPKDMTFETEAGFVSAQILDDRQVKVKLNNPSIIKLEDNVEIDGSIYENTYIELGNPGLPHSIIKLDLDEIELDDLYELGRKARYHENFPKGSNVNFYQLINEDSVKVKTYERGVEDFTLACGTGSASTAVALILKGDIKRNRVNVHVDGGILTIEVDRKGDQIENLYLIGDTNIVAKGIITDEDLNL